MNIFQAMIMGLVQGLTEFLPVSSSGHLVLARTLMRLPDTDPLVFEIIVHVGTLIAVLVVFRRDVWNMIKHPFSKPTLMLVVATIPAVLAALFLDDFIEETFGGSYLGIGFLLTAIILTVSELVRPKRQKKLADMTYGDATVMGVMQAVALFPGISRSGSTISGGLFCGVNRPLATRFAFLMSIPAILGSLVFKFKDLLGGAESIGIGPMVAGLIMAAVSGYLAIKFMLHLVRKQKLYGFAIYVAILGALVLLDQYVFNIFFTATPF